MRGFSNKNTKIENQYKYNKLFHFMAISIKKVHHYSNNTTQQKA